MEAVNLADDVPAVPTCEHGLPGGAPVAEDAGDGAMVFHPGKKNRNFGTKKRGHGQDNRHVVPESWHDDRLYYEKLLDYRTLDLRCGSKRISFLVEVPRPDCYYAVTPEDAAHLLSALPHRYVRGLDLFVLRQPTRRQRTLNACWGRIAYFTEIDDEHRGVAIYLDALPADRSWTRSKSLTPEDAKELARLESLGVEVDVERRALRLTSNPDADRNVQLYHTILHELGHLEDSDLHDRFGLWDDEDLSAEAERRIIEGTPHYDQKPAVEREVYAHRFSDDRRRELRARGVIPFERRFDRVAMAKAGVLPEWFEASA